MTAIPRRVGSYEITRVLGRGGMGVVYLGWDGRLGRRVAIKVLARSILETSDALRRFQREARILAALSHPLIASVIELARDVDAGWFLVMEYVEGRTLAERLRDGPLPLSELLPIARDIATALHEAHSHDIVHRDLKPQNVMLRPSGSVKVLDFGLAKDMRSPAGKDRALDSLQPAESLSTVEGVILGTPGYMSPEQIRGLDLDGRADVFSFGVILFECLAGRKAFRGSRPGEVLANTLMEEPAWDSLPDQVPAAVRDLIRLCLEKDRDRRLNSPLLVRSQIEHWLQGDPESAELRVLGLPTLPANLPRTPTSFVGRRHELASCQGLIGAHRLLTLTGAGGCGKTRLAIELIRRLQFQPRDAIHFVSLRTLDASQDPIRATAESLGLRDQPERSVLETIQDSLGRGNVLLVLDNCEHVQRPCARFVKAILEACPNLQVLATSREILDIAGEQVFQVGPLEVPDRHERDALPRSGVESDAVTLFVDRARSLQPLFEVDETNRPVIGEICRQLDGIPLAVELAAARVRVLSPQEILERLSERFRLLHQGPTAGFSHYSTLEQAIEWSYQLLTPGEQELFRAVSIFAGGFGIEGAVAVAGDDVDEYEVLEALDQLVAKSVVVVQEVSATARYDLLESLRQYGRQQLRAHQESSDVSRRHCRHYAGLAARSKQALEGPEQGDWLQLWDREHSNALLALDTASESRDLVADGVRLCVGIWRYWFKRGLLRVGREQLTRCLGQCDSIEIEPQLLGDAYNACATFSYALADNETSIGLYLKSIEIFEQAGAEAGWVVASTNLANPLLRKGDLAGAEQLLVRALDGARRVGEARYTASIVANLGALQVAKGLLEPARSYFEEAVATFRQAGDPHGVRLALTNLAYVFDNLGLTREARAHYAESIVLMKRLGDNRDVVSTLAKIVPMEVEAGDLESARRVLGECLELVGEVQDALAQINSVEASASFAVARGEHRVAAEMIAATQTRRTEWGLAYEPAEQRRTDVLLASIRSSLTDETFDLAWHSGVPRTLDDLLGEARRQLTGVGLPEK